MTSGAPTQGGGAVTVELVGPAGAGKSTIFASLVRRGGIRGMPVLSRSRWAPLLLAELLRAVSTIVRAGAVGRQWNGDRLMMMAYLQALPRVLARPRTAATRAVVFDQGPIFFLTRPVFQDPRLRAWRERTFQLWFSVLDAVVLLEAPDHVLIDRVNAREKVHRMKGRPEPAALEFIADGRAAFDHAIRAFEVQAPGTLARFDTSRCSADDVAEAILALLEEPAQGAAGDRSGAQ